ncbi:MAG TPA: transglutaminase family protein [Propionibacteriaceae bacterium]|nr:transglutaminase family protein [Propionibacteriaceae bacterium]
MTRYRIEHSTTYTYDADVTGSYGTFHLRPRDEPWQSCLSHEVVITPEPADLFRHQDMYGNTKTYFHVVEPHTELKVTAINTVEVRARDYDPDLMAVPWEQTRPRLRPDQPDAWLATDFTFASPMVDVPAEARAYAEESFRPGRGIAEAVTDLMHRVYRDFTYKSGSTTVSTRVGELLQRRTGVCQDFTHVMVSSLRSLGLAGRYVSGYLATRPPPGKPRVVGADASHAWVGCWIPGAGWLYLDPTNDRLADESHATVAWGRDYADVTPVKGVIFTESKSSVMKVSVDMAPAEETSALL